MVFEATENEKPKASCRVIIVGGGLAGLATAIGIRRAGLQVLALEQAPELREIGAGIEIPPNSSKVLAKWGLLETLKLNALRIPDIVHHSYRDGSLLSKANLDPHCESDYGAPHLCVHRVDFHNCLLQNAKELGVDIKFGCSISSVDFNIPAVTLRSGEVHEADVVLGSDGERSVCREALLGRPDPPQHSGDLVYRILLKSERIRQRKDLFGIMDPVNFHIWSGPGGHAISYALKRDDEYNIVLTQPDSSVDKLGFGQQSASISELRAIFEDWDPRIKALLEIAIETSKWTLFESSDLSSWTHPAGKFALVGDAAHAMFPFLGQGAAQAVEDAAVLSTFFANLTNVSQIPDLLLIYDNLRRPRAMKIKQRSREMRVTHAYPDGLMQQERDRQLTRHEPFEGYPAAWADPVLQKWMWGHDILEEAEEAWAKYIRGEWPGTRGGWRSSVSDVWTTTS